MTASVRIVLAWVFACFALVSAMSARAQEYVLRSEPTWVDRLEIPANDQSARASDGTRYLLLDDQVDATGVRPQWYRRAVYALELDRALSEGGQFTIGFQPDYQQVQLHAIDVIRDGQRSSRLDDARVQVLRREDGLESGILDGEHTLSITIPDLRVGDVVDYRYSVVGFNPIFGNAFYDSYWARYSTAVGVRRVRAIHDAKRPLHWRAPSDYQGTTSAEGGRRIIDIRATKLARVRTEDDIPGSHDAWGRIELTTAAHWRDIVQWALPLYPTRIRDRELADSLIQRLQLHDKDKRAAMLRAVAYVQGDIRYTALDMGQNSHAPYTPETTASRRFGDCKDKAALLVALLAEAGIQAHPVLVNTEAEDGVRDRAPSGYAFDHVVVRAKVAGHDVWIDATRDREAGPFESRTPLPFKAGLPICAGCDGFVDVPAPMPAQPDVDVGEVIGLRGDGKEYVADFTIVTDYRNGRAVSVLDRFEDEDIDTLAEEYLGYMREYYEGSTRSADPTVRALGDARARLTERYAVRWKQEVSDFGIVLFQLNDYLPDLADKARRMPLELSGPRYARHTIRSTLADGWVIPTETEVVENRYFRFTRTSRVEKGDLVVTGEWRRLQDVVRPGDCAAFRKDVEKTRELLTYEVDLAPPVSDMFTDQRMGWPIAALVLVGIAGLAAWRLRDRATAAGMLFRPRATIPRVLETPSALGWAGALLIVLATMEVVLGAGGKYLVEPSTGLAGVWLEWFGYFFKFVVGVALMGWGFKLLSAPIGYRNLFVATVWSIAPPILIGYIGAIVALGGDLSPMLNDAAAVDGRYIELLVAGSLIIVGCGWAGGAAIKSFSATANITSGHAFVAATIGLFTTALLFVPLTLAGL